ncbi:MAG TPA: hypothetical protein VLF67_03940 [Candidatus Saccharimonas sp.]|nr:hypothetical protein [Candidatus Saccharimonas sp.]
MNTMLETVNQLLSGRQPPAEANNRLTPADTPQVMDLYAEYAQTLQALGVPPWQFKIAVYGQDERPYDFVVVKPIVFTGSIDAWPAPEPGPAEVRYDPRAGAKHWRLAVGTENTLYTRWYHRDDALDLTRGALDLVAMMKNRHYCGPEWLRWQLVQCAAELTACGE